MQIRIGFDIELGVTAPTALIYMLQVHPSRAGDLQGGGEHLTISPPLPTDHYADAFGNQCARVHVPMGVSSVRLRNHATVYDTGWPDAVDFGAAEHSAADLPVETLPFVLPSRYCEVDSELLAFAWANFSSVTPGWSRNCPPARHGSTARSPSKARTARPTSRRCRTPSTAARPRPSSTGCSTRPF